MDKYSFLINALDKICIPVIIGIITFVIAKRQITNAGVTQFRQKWIDDLRDAISIFIAKAEMVSMLNYDEDQQYFEYFKDLSQMHNKIELMLNPLEDDHNKMLSITNEIRELVHEEDINEDKLEKELDKKVKKLLEISKVILKREWNVVKKGK